MITFLFERMQIFLMDVIGWLSWNFTEEKAASEVSLGKRERHKLWARTCRSCFLFSRLSPIDVEVVVVWWFIVNMPNQSRHFFFLFALSLDNQFKFSRSLAEVVVSFSLFALRCSAPPPSPPLRMINSPSLSLSLFPVETPFFSLSRSLGLCSFTCSVALSFRLFAIINRGPVILLALGTRCLSFSFSLSLVQLGSNLFRFSLLVVIIITSEKRQRWANDEQDSREKTRMTNDMERVLPL